MNDFISIRRFLSMQHCVKCVQIRKFFWSVFSRIRMNTMNVFLSLRIQSKCGKIRTRKNSVFGQFSRSVIKYIIKMRMLFWLYKDWSSSAETKQQKKVARTPLQKKLQNLKRNVNQYRLYNWVQCKCW